LIGLKDNHSEKINIRKASPEIARALGMDRAQDPSYPEVVMREMQISYPEVRQLRIYAVPIERSGSQETEGGKAGLAVVMTDFTEELDDLNAKIESERVSSIMDLAAGVAHELGNPLNSYQHPPTSLAAKLKKVGIRFQNHKVTYLPAIKRFRDWMVSLHISLKQLGPLNHFQEN
jgi:signal transduction histidine kinase